MNESAIAKRLAPVWKRGREGLGWTQMDAAKAIKCSPSEISSYEHGKRLPGVPRFVVMCKVYKLNPGRLLLDVAAGIR